MKFFFAVTNGNLAPQDRKTSREQRGALFQSSKRNADSSGSLNRCAIQYEVSVCASHLPKHSRFVLATAGVTFKLANLQSVRFGRNYRSAIVSALLPEKDSLLQSFRQAFFKRPRTPLGAYPSCRVPRVSFVPYFSRAPKPALSAHLAAALPAGVTIDESLSH